MNSSKTEITNIPTIKGINELTIINYFATINQENFEATAALFIEQGQLLVPFEKPIIGKNAIAKYLSQEAKGMKLLPQQGVYESLKDDTESITVTGKVKTILFSVNVAWYFSLNSAQKIITAKIKLLASPQELLGLKQKRDNTANMTKAEC